MFNILKFVSVDHDIFFKRFLYAPKTVSIKGFFVYNFHNIYYLAYYRDYI